MGDSFSAQCASVLVPGMAQSSGEQSTVRGGRHSRSQKVTAGTKRPAHKEAESQGMKWFAQGQTVAGWAAEIEPNPHALSRSGQNTRRARQAVVTATFSSRVPAFWARCLKRDIDRWGAMSFRDGWKTGSL